MKVGATMTHEKKQSIVYQIYPRSFYDSNGDGIGDLQGIIQKVPYLLELGVNTVWLSPVYASPMDDNGYDISDYCDIHPDYGTLDDMKQLIELLHQNKIQLIMDLVINHTSDEHPWFKASSSSTADDKRAYYIWRKGRKNNTKPPNNWTSFFTGKAWTYSEKTASYYLHLFSKKQPDLNWEHKPLRDAIKTMIQFWIDLGVDGFRCDVINLISKKPGLPNGKPNIALVGKEHYANGPKVHDYLHELNQALFAPNNIITVGECIFISPKEAFKYVSAARQELDMVFHFQHMWVDTINNKWFIRRFKMRKLKKILNAWQTGLEPDGWNTLYFENHDQPRAVSRFGNDSAYRVESAKMLATVLYFQKGTPYIYQGQELGMTNAYFEDINDYRDIETHNVYRIGREKLKFTHARMMKKIKYMGRDNARTPMQWRDQLYAGFSTVEPWLKVNPNYPNINVSEQTTNPNSVLNYYKALIDLRKQYPVFIDGTYTLLHANHKQLYAYTREDRTHKALIICNFSNKPLNVDFEPALKSPPWRVILTNTKGMKHTFDKTYAPYEAWVLVYDK